jgi:ribonuclease P protein component
VVRKADERFPWRQRIVKSSDFRSLYGTGRRLDAGKFVLFGRPNDLGFHRLGLTVSRKIGGAVLRNRWKRLLREAFRLTRERLPTGLDMVVIPRSAAAPELSALVASLPRLADRLAGRLADRT